MSTPLMQPPTSAPVRSYLSEGHSVASWLLTRDHKRIAILYLLTLTFFFFVGGFFAVLIRLELLTPEGDLVSADTYNKLFSMHGIVMVFLFLIPSVPAVLGNFLIPMMIGARDLAFPGSTCLAGTFTRSAASLRCGQSHPVVSIPGGHSIRPIAVLTPTRT